MFLRYRTSTYINEYNPDGPKPPVSLEGHLNTIANEGWRLVTVVMPGTNFNGKKIWQCFWERKDW